MPPTPKAATPAAPPKKLDWVMPRPPAFVLWRNAPGGDTVYAVVTKYNRHSVNLMLFPPDSRVGVPKEGVRFVGDPWNQAHGINPDSGVWEWTEESVLLRKLSTLIDPAV